MKFTEAVLMVKQGAYIPVNARAQWKQLSNIARSNTSVPARAGESFASFAKHTDPGIVNTIKKQIAQLGLGDKLNTLRFRGPVMEENAATTSRFVDRGQLQPWSRAFYRPDVSIRRVAMDSSAMPAAHDMNRSLATPNLKLFASAPGGILGPNLVKRPGPIVDVYLNNDYMQKNKIGQTLVDLDTPLGPREQARQKLTPGKYTRPDRMFRMFSPKPAAEHVLPYGQTVRQGNGRVDDVGGLIFYPTVGHTNVWGDMYYDPGYLFTTTMSSNPFTRRANGFIYRNKYGDLQDLRKVIEQERKGFLSFLTPGKAYDDKKFMRTVGRKGLDNGTYKAKQRGPAGNLVIEGNRIYNPIILTKEDREVWANNYLRNHKPQNTPSFIRRIIDAFRIFTKH